MSPEEVSNKDGKRYEGHLRGFRGGFKIPKKKTKRLSVLTVVLAMVACSCLLLKDNVA